MKRILMNLLLLASLCLLNGQEYLFYAVSNDQNNSRPVYLCQLDSVSGAMTKLADYSGVMKGNYFALSPDHSQLMVTSMNSSRNQGGLVQYDIADDGSLSLSHSELSPGGVPCHVSFTPDSAHVLSAYYGDDKIAVNGFSEGDLDAETDRITKADKARGHCILADPSGKHVYAVFLGLDRVYSYTLQAGSFVANTHQEFFSLPAGHGPRHLAFHPDSSWVYIINEYHSSVTACSYDTSTGALSQIQEISMLPEGYVGDNTGAAIRVHPTGSFLYASNRGHNSIAAFEILDDGTLRVIEQEASGINWPRDFNFSPDGSFMLVANQKGNTLSSYRIDSLTGVLTPTDQSWPISAPMSIIFLPEEEEEVDIPTGGHASKSIREDMCSVYPNPASGVLQLLSPGQHSIEAAELFDMAGKPVLQSHGPHLQYLDVSALPRGSYILLLRMETGIARHIIVLR